MRRIGRPGAFVHADRPEAARLEHPDQFQPNHLEKSEKRDDEAAAIVSVGEKLFESACFGFGEPSQQLLDAGFNRHLFGRQDDLRPVLGPLDHSLEVIETLRNNYPASGLIVCCLFCGPAYQLALLAGGVDEVVGKESISVNLLPAIRRVAARHP